MKSRTITFIIALLVVACTSGIIVNSIDSSLSFDDIRSDFTVKDTNSYGCEKINMGDLKHVLEYGVLSTERDIHDYYSTVGCSVGGSLLMNGERQTFTFDYGGIFRFSNGTILSCGKRCCENNFKYCTWDTTPE